MPFFVADNIITSLGSTTSENWDTLMKGGTGIRQVTDPVYYKEPFQAALVDHALMDQKFSGLGDPADFTRLEKMMILSISDALQHVSMDATSARTVLIISTTKGNIDLLQRDNLAQFPADRVELRKVGQVIDRYLGSPTPPVVLSNACISGVLAINMAAMLIKSGRYDHAIVAGGDLVSRFVVSGFMSFLSLSPAPCKPFDKYRDGLSLGEAVGTVILSREKTGRDDILWLGGASANDANHISGPSRTGEGSFLAIQNALREAGVSTREIDHISAHGTATPYNDEMESISIGRHGLERAPVNSMKGYWGHTLGAAGVVETAILLQEMKRSRVLKSAGYSEHGVSRPLNVAAENLDRNLNTCLKMASGFGGSNAAMIIQKV